MRNLIKKSIEEWKNMDYDNEIESICIANKLIEDSWCILLSVILSILLFQIRLKFVPIFIKIVVEKLNDTLNLLSIIVRKSIAFLKIDEFNILAFNVSST